MKWVRLEANTVREIIPDAATVPGVAHWYGDAFAAECREAPDEVQQRWVYDPDTDTWSEPPPPPEPEPEAESDIEAFIKGMMEEYING